MIETYKQPLRDFAALLEPYLGRQVQTFLHSPKQLVSFILDQKLPYTVAAIENWEKLEDSKTSLADYQPLRDLVFYNVKDTEALYLLTDDGLFEEACFMIPGKSAFENFNLAFEAHYQKGIYQAADYIGYAPGSRVLNIIYHEGLLWSADLTHQHARSQL